MKSGLRRERVVGKYENKAEAARVAMRLGRELVPKLGKEEAGMLAAHELAHAVDTSKPAGTLGYNMDIEGNVIEAWQLSENEGLEDVIRSVTAPARRGLGFSQGDSDILKEALRERRMTRG